ALVGSTSVGFTLLGCVLASNLCERWTCRVTNGIGILSSLLGLVLSSLARSIYPLYFTYSLFMGFGNACSLCASFISVRRYFDKHYYLAMGICTSGTGMGVLVFVPLSQLLIDFLGWRDTFRVFATGAVLLLLLTFIYDPNVEVPLANNASAASAGAATESPCRGMFDLSVWKYPDFTVAVVAISISSFGHMAPFVNLIKYSAEQGVSAQKGSLLFVFIGISSIISRLISARLCDVSFIKPRHVNQAAAVLSGVVTILLTLASTFTFLAVLAVAYGVADGAYKVTINILFINSVDLKRGPSAFGQAQMVTSLSSVAGPAIAG
ncbi:predicted protein, partial [Nematostella vectensis]